MAPVLSSMVGTVVVPIPIVVLIPEKLAIADPNPTIVSDNPPNTLLLLLVIISPILKLSEILSLPKSD